MWPFRLWRWRYEIQQAADFHGFEPALVAAIMDRESLGGEALNPPTRLGVGDFTHGKGLMQIDDRSHAQFCESIETWGNALLNVMKGCEVMSWARGLCKGHLPGIPAIYNAGWARQHNGVTTPWIRELYAANPTPEPISLDKYTTGNDYCTDVLSRYERLKKVQFT